MIKLLYSWFFFCREEINHKKPFIKNVCLYGWTEKNHLKTLLTSSHINTHTHSFSHHPIIIKNRQSCHYISKVSWCAVAKRTKWNGSEWMKIKWGRARETWYNVLRRNEKPFLSLHSTAILYTHNKKNLLFLKYFCVCL